MPTWREVIQDEEYQKLPLGDRIKTKYEFYKNTISNSDKFKNLATEKQDEVRNNFFIDKPEEMLDPSLPEKPSLGQVAEYVKEEFQQNSPFKYLDKPVEEVARFIEPDTAKEGIRGMAEFIPRQMLAEVIRGYKPSTAGAFGVGMKIAKPLLKPVGKVAGKIIDKVVPKKVKDILLKELTVGKGKPIEYQNIAKEAELERAIGGREAEDVAKKLTVAPKDITGITKTGEEIITKKGQQLSPEYQKYVGRIFRKEVDIGGKLSRVTETPEMAQHIAKNVEVEVAFNPTIKSLQDDLVEVNKMLRNKELKAGGLVGKEFMTETGFKEKITGVSKVAKVTPTGKLSKKRFDIGVVSEPVNPLPPTESPIPAEIAQEGERIIRSTDQIFSKPATNKFVNASRKNLLHKRKLYSQQLQKEIEGIETGVRSNYHIFNREFSEQIRNHPKYQELSAIADEGRVVMDKWSKSLSRSGIPKKETAEIIDKNVGEYMARMFPKYLEKPTNAVNQTKVLRLRLDGLKHRKNLTQEVIDQMIKEPALPTAIRVKQISTSIANNKLFNKVAVNPEWVAESNVTGNLVKMPDSATLGALKGKWVVPEIAEDINAINGVSANKRGIYLKLLSAWKYGKVVLNPAAQTRNAISNSILLDLSGVNHFRQLQLFPKAFTEYLTKGKLYQQALADGAIGGEFVGVETMQQLKDSYLKAQGGNFQKWLATASIPFKKAGELYQGMEQVSKMVKYIDVLSKTKNRVFAAKEAQKWLFNYAEVPHFIDVVRKHPLGSPFITFTYKAVPRIAETLINRPMAVYKYKAMFDAVNETSRKYLGMTPIEYAREKRLLPPWTLKDIGGIPTNLLLPWKDKYNRTQWLNLEYLLPIGQTPEIAETGLKGVVTNPLFNMVSDIIKNTDFKNTPIVPPEATKAEAAIAIAEYIYRQLAPNLAPGGYSFEKIRAGAVQEPERYNQDRTRELAPAILDSLLGIKINPLDVKEAQDYEMWNINKRDEALTKEFYKIINNPITSEEYKDKKIEDIFQKKERLIDDYRPNRTRPGILKVISDFLLPEAGATEVPNKMVKDYFRKKEGLPPKGKLSYPDIYGNQTSGVGHKVLPGEDPKKMGKEATLDKDIEIHTKRAKKLFPSLDTYPNKVQVALIDGVLRGEHKINYKTTKLINSGQWDKVADEYLDNAEYRKSKNPKNKMGGIAKRMEEHAETFRNYARSLKKK